MVIDFKEIPQANEATGQQDDFELFSRDFLEAIGYKIVRQPDRGADGGKDLVVSETLNGISNQVTRTWLVSCKHFAHSGRSVTEQHEQNIYERVDNFQCQGFIGIYSTIAHASLSNRLFGIRDKCPSIIYDHAQIEKMILGHRQREQILLRYFPKSYIEYRCRLDKGIQTVPNHEKAIPTSYTEEDLLRINKTAIIIIEIEKIKEAYWKANWERRNQVIEHLSKYADHSNYHIEQLLFQFLYDVSTLTRANMPYDSADSIYWMILTFFRGIYGNTDRDQKIEIAKQCIQIGDNIIYDAFIHLRNLAIAMLGLNIIKYIYRGAKEGNVKELKDQVNRTYNELEATLRRPERNDLGNSQELLKIFREDLEERNLAFPPLPNKLQSMVNADAKRIY